MIVRAIRHFVDSQGESHAIGEIFEMDDAEAKEYIGRTGYARVIEAASEFEYQQQQAVATEEEETPPTQTLADVVAANNIRALLRLVDNNHLDAAEVLEIEKNRPDPRVSLIAELEKRIG